MLVSASLCELHHYRLQCTALFSLTCPNMLSNIAYERDATVVSKERMPSD